jgi:hypothetical protein
VVTLRVLQTSCGLLAVAALLALAQTPPPQIATHDGAATVASANPAVPTEWRNAAGPLAIPTIGVVPPGTDDWFDPSAEPSFRPAEPLPTSYAVPSVTEAPERTTDESTPTTAAPTTSAAPTTAEASPLPTTEVPQRTEAPANDVAPATTTPTTTPGTTTSETTTPETTTPETTTPETTTPETTPGTTTSETTTPETTTTETTTPQTTPPSSTTEVPTPTEEPVPTPPPVLTSDRGNVVLEFGKPFTVVDNTGTAAFTTVVDSVATDVVCTAPDGVPAVNGHLIALQVRVTTGADLSVLGLEPALLASDFRVLAADGVTLTDAATPSADSCLPDETSLPAGPLTPDQELAGTVVLEVAATTGTIVFAPGFLSTGAEWTYAPLPEPQTE